MLLNFKVLPKVVSQIAVERTWIPISGVLANIFYNMNTSLRMGNNIRQGTNLLFEEKKKEFSSGTGVKIRGCLAV